MTRKTSVEEIGIDYKFVCNQNGLLLAAVDAGSVEEINKLLKECGDLTSEVVNAPCGLMKITALQLAASKGKKADQLVKVLLEYGAKADSSDKVGRTPLHNAALVGNAEAVKILLQAGANVDACFQVNSWPRQTNYLVGESDCNEFSTEFKLPVPECWGRTPLHQAVKGGNPECVRLLLEAKANVNAQDEKGVTPLLLTGTGIFPGNKREVNKYEEVVELLVKAGADVNAYSEFTGLTAMHHAAELCSLRAMRCLLNNNAVIPEMKSNGVRTVLHEAAHKGNLAIVELLLQRGAEKLVNSADRNGHTPLHKAAFAGSRECLASLLKHGGDLAAESIEGVSVMDTIFSHIPRPINFISDILDRHIVTNNSDINDRNFKVILDFSILCPKGSDRQMAVVTALMDGGSDLQQKQIVRHPLFETFLRFKWHRLRLFFYILMAVHFLLVISLSLFCSLMVQKDKIDSGILSLSHKALLFAVIMLTIHVVIQVVMLPRYYIAQYETWINLLSIILSLAIAIGHLTGSMEPFLKDGIPTQNAWILHIMSFAVLLVWIEFMLLIGRIPTWGYYALMFYQVLRNVIKVLLTFSGLVIGFTFSFRVQFHDSEQFMTVWHSFVKTMIMMMGEYDYNDLFDGSSDEATKKLRLIGTSRVIFFIFVVLSSIVLMNLMVGLAVSDIQELQVEGHMQRLLKQAEFVTHLEKLTMHHLIPHWLHRLLAIRRCIDPKFEIQPSEFKSGNNNLSYHLLERIISIAVSNQRKSNNHFPNRNSYSDQEIFSSKYVEYGSTSEEPLHSPASPMDNTSSIITILLQLQMEIAEIRAALNTNQTNMPSSMNNEEQTAESVRISRWTRPVNDIQDAQGILKRLRRSSKTQNVVV